MSASNAAGLVSIIPIGWIIGCPLMGFISDRMGRRKPVLIGGGIAMGILTLSAIYTQPSLAVRYLLGLGLGISSGAAMIPFSMIKEANPPEVKGSAAGAMNFLCFGVTGVLSPVLAKLLAPMPGQTETLVGFQHGLLALAFGIAVALVLCFFLRETGHTEIQPGRGASEQVPAGESTIHGVTFKPAAGRV